jgi:hypothetical protein
MLTPIMNRSTGCICAYFSRTINSISGLVSLTKAFLQPGTDVLENVEFRLHRSMVRQEPPCDYPDQSGISMTPSFRKVSILSPE